MLTETWQKDLLKTSLSYMGLLHLLLSGGNHYSLDLKH